MRFSYNSAILATSYSMPLIILSIMFASVLPAVPAAHAQACQGENLRVVGELDSSVGCRAAPVTEGDLPKDGWRNGSSSDSALSGYMSPTLSLSQFEFTDHPTDEQLQTTKCIKVRFFSLNPTLRPVDVGFIVSAPKLLEGGMQITPREAQATTLGAATTMSIIVAGVLSEGVVNPMHASLTFTGYMAQAFLQRNNGFRVNQCDDPAV